MGANSVNQQHPQYQPSMPDINSTAFTQISYMQENKAKAMHQRHAAIKSNLAVAHRHKSEGKLDLATKFFSACFEKMKEYVDETKDDREYFMFVVKSLEEVKATLDECNGKQTTVPKAQPQGNSSFRPADISPPRGVQPQVKNTQPLGYPVIQKV